MRRREFIAGLAGATVWPLVTRAQQAGGVRRVGILQTMSRTDVGHLRVDAFKKGLAELGWTEGRNIRFEERWADGNADRLPVNAAELARLVLEAIFVDNSPCLKAMRQATSDIPIIFSTVTDPVGQGFVSSLARPGGNITGFAGPEFGISTKVLELLKKLAPSVDRVVALYDPAQPATVGKWDEIEAAAPSLALRASKVPVRTVDEIERAVTAVAREPNSGLYVIPGTTTGLYHEMIAALALRHGLPAVGEFRYFVEGGGVASYGPDDNELSRRAASYVDRILKGEKPRDLPVQLPTKFELVLNLKTAKALGLTVPQSILLSADEVIE
jgi:putative ABC transport system substrate-binding protein